jgi:hypothetical protein
VSSGKSPEAVLFDLEAKMLEAIDIAWAEYEQIGGIPPSNLIKLMTDTHKAVLARVTKRIGFTFDPNNLPAALVEVEKQRDIIMRMMRQREMVS